MTINIDKAQQVDINGARRLFDFGFWFREKDADTGTVEDITGWVYEMKIFAPSNDTVALLTINTTNYLTIADNKVNINVPGASFTVPKGNLQYIIKRTKLDIVEAIMSGKLIVI